MDKEARSKGSRLIEQASKRSPVSTIVLVHGSAAMITAILLPERNDGRHHSSPDKIRRHEEGSTASWQPLSSGAVFHS